MKPRVTRKLNFKSRGMAILLSAPMVTSNNLIINYYIYSSEKRGDTPSSS
jgi:hypothetical protein